MSETEIEPKQEAPQSTQLEFPEDKVQGQGYSQYNNKTGWLWIGIKLPAFNFRTAWAFIRSQEFLVSQIFDQIEQVRINNLQLNRPGKPNGPLSNILRNLRRPS